MPSRRPSIRDAAAVPRLRVLEALQRGARTVNDLAPALGVTRNAVRGHLATLQREGLVRSTGVVRSGVPGKPAVEYEATLDAEVALSRAYAPALVALVEALADRMESRALTAALRDAGRRLGPALRQAAPLPAAAAAARTILSELGGSVRIESGRTHADVRGDGCPLAAAVARVPATCTMVEAMLEAQTGRAVEQRCEHGNRPRCAFRLS
jgi:predicted ArsR family transcriptional regulator